MGVSVGAAVAGWVGDSVRLTTGVGSPVAPGCTGTLWVLCGASVSTGVSVGRGDAVGAGVSVTCAVGSGGRVAAAFTSFSVRLFSLRRSA